MYLNSDRPKILKCLYIWLSLLGEGGELWLVGNATATEGGDANRSENENNHSTMTNEHNDGAKDDMREYSLNNARAFASSLDRDGVTIDDTVDANNSNNPPQQHHET